MQQHPTFAHDFKPGDLAVILPLDGFPSDYAGTVCEILSEPFHAAFATECADETGMLCCVRHADGEQHLMFGQEHATPLSWLVYVPEVPSRNRPPAQSKESLQRIRELENTRLKTRGMKRRAGLTVRDVWGPRCPQYFVA